MFIWPMSFHLHWFILQFFLIYFFFLPCGLSLDLAPLKYTYAMVFAVQEINQNSTLLPGVKLGYRVINNCGRYPWALQDALSLVGEDSRSCNLTYSSSRSPSEPIRDTASRLWLDVMWHAVIICYVHETNFFLIQYTERIVTH